MTSKAHIAALLNMNEDQIEDDLVTFDNMDSAIIGITVNGQGQRLVYSRKKIIEAIAVNEEITDEAAEDHFGYNIGGFWMGEQTPIIMEEKQGEIP